MLRVGAIIVLLGSIAAGGAFSRSLDISNQFAAGSSTLVRRLIDINTASASELKLLPGIRDAYAAAIIKNRPYDNKHQLLSRKILPVATYETIRTRIIAKQ